MAELGGVNTASMELWNCSRKKFTLVFKLRLQTKLTICSFFFQVMDRVAVNGYYFFQLQLQLSNYSVTVTDDIF